MEDIFVFQQKIIQNSIILVEKEQEVKIEINNPVYDVNGRYLVIGEKGQPKAFLFDFRYSHIYGKKKVDGSGNLSKVTVNRSGYVTTIISGTRSYKSVIVTYDDKEMNYSNLIYLQYNSSRCSYFTR